MKKAAKKQKNLTNTTFSQKNLKFTPTKINDNLPDKTRQMKNINKF